MDYRKHRTPSGLPPSNFEEPGEVSHRGRKPINELEYIIHVGVWPPPEPNTVAVLHENGARAWLFRAQDGRISAWSSIVWWEKRRLAFNLLLGCGILCAIALRIIITFAFQAKLSGFPVAESDIVFVVSPVAVMWEAALCNIAFTFGWVIECLLRSISRNRNPDLGPLLLNVGACLTLGCIVYFFVLSLHQALCH